MRYSGQAEHLERDEHREQVVGGDEGHHPGQREQREREDSVCIVVRLPRGAVNRSSVSATRRIGAATGRHAAPPPTR
jgi:hypothetical protein